MQIFGLEKFVLITSLYGEKNVGRVEEYKRCLLKNISHDLIDEVLVFFDTNNADSENKILNFLYHNSISVEYIQGRPSFQFLFEQANKRYPNHLVMVANADIYFNQTLHNLKTIDFENTFVSLTRWNEHKNGSLEPQDSWRHYNEMSHDVWIFKTPISIPNCSSILLGTWQCDGKISRCAFEAGYKVINPCLEVQACHVHTSQVRNYTKPKRGEDLQIIYNSKVCFGGVSSFFQNNFFSCGELFNIYKTINTNNQIFCTQEAYNKIMELFSSQIHTSGLTCKVIDSNKILDIFGETMTDEPFLICSLANQLEPDFYKNTHALSWHGFLETNLAAYLIYPIS